MCIRDRIHIYEKKAKEAKKKQEDAERKRVEAEARRKDAERQRQIAERRTMDAIRDKELAEVRSADIVKQAEKCMMVAERRAVEAERRVQFAEVRARDAEEQLHQSQSFWRIPRQEIELTNEKLGKGAWGKVKVALFRGSRVAAKCYHQILLSEHNIKHFHREIIIATRLHHPNLVQFIGASMEGELILLTELMTTNLCVLMGRGPLGEAQIISISLDVARALNYLHLMKPHPIIHRDIGSSNVLLDPLPGNCWKAKVSDYGSVNLVQHLTTAHPGNPFYAAPESEIPSHQTPKMDIYSFGFLLAEMLTDEIPEKKDRHCQILKISVEHPRFVELVGQCQSEERENRPTAQELIDQLCQM